MSMTPTKVVLAFRVNGEPVEVGIDPHKTLLEVLREELGLTGTKHGCDLGECGACAVLVDGTPLLSCLAIALDHEGADVTTVEGLERDGRLHPIQAAFADLGGSQCGYCSPGFLTTAAALLDAKPDATREEVAEALSGNLCRCTGYQAIHAAVQRAGQEIVELRKRGER